MEGRRGRWEGTGMDIEGLSRVPHGKGGWQEGGHGGMSFGGTLPGQPLLVGTVEGGTRGCWGALRDLPGDVPGSLRGASEHGGRA